MSLFADAGERPGGSPVPPLQPRRRGSSEDQWAKEPNAVELTVAGPSRHRGIKASEDPGGPPRAPSLDASGAEPGHEDDQDPPVRPLDQRGLMGQARRLRSWGAGLLRTYGCGFLMLISVVYWVQGFKSFAGLAVSYLFKDVLKLEPAASQALTTTMGIPWVIKPVYGLMSDNLPICGYRRRPYLLLFAVLACLSYFALAVPWLSPGALIATLLLLVTSLSLAVSDVVVDARVVEMARRDPANGANDLQSICWSSLALGGFLGSLLSGPAVRYLKPRGVFLLAAIGPGIIVVLSLLMRESRVRRSREGCLPTAKAQGQQLLRALMLPVVWKSALFIFLSTASSPSFGQVSFYYATDVLHFSPEFLGALSAVGYVLLMVGTLVYNSFFKHVAYRPMLLWAQLALVVISLSEILLVTRVNLVLGIPDKVFVLGDEIISDVFSRMKKMPLFVLCARLCPPGVEGALFSLLMSVANISGSVSAYWGAIVCSLLGISLGHYERLWAAVLIRTVCKLLPVFFLFLIPDTDPDAEIASFARQTAEGEAAGGDGDGDSDSDVDFLGDGRAQAASVADVFGDDADALADDQEGLLPLDSPSGRGNGGPGAQEEVSFLSDASL